MSALRSSPVAPERTLRLSLGSFDVGVAGFRVLAVVSLLAAVLGGVYAWRARPLAAGEPIPPPKPLATATTPLAVVVVHVAGKVRRPGIVTLPAGSRVADALRAAGGVKPGVSTDGLNLARRLVDGEQILVPPSSGGGAGTGAASSGDALVDLNSATVEQLEQLPGVGPVLAQRIVEFRERNGGFRSVEQLREVTGIGERKYSDLKGRVRV